MIDAPKFFKRAISGKSISLTSIVHIYPTATTDVPLAEQDIDLDTTLKISSQSISLMNKPESYQTSEDKVLSYNPLLKKIPQIKDTLDVINSEHTISSSSLEIINTKTSFEIGRNIHTEGKFSDIVRNYLGSVVQIYYAANNTKYLQDCLLIYTGVIKRYEQTKDTIKLQLEDLSSIKYSVNIPSNLMPLDESVRERDRGLPYPMVYGYVRYAPTRQNLIDLSGDGNFTLESFVIDKPNANLGGVIEADDEYLGNPDLMSPYHPINYYGVTPYTQENGTEWAKDFLYIYDKEFLHISKIAPEKLGISYGQIDDKPADIQLYLNKGTQLYYYDNTTNTVRFKEAYFSQMSQLYSDWATFQEKETLEADEENPWERIEFEPDYIFTRIYRPIKRVIFYGNKTIGNNTGIDADINFYGFSTNQYNGGYLWKPHANLEANLDYVSNTSDEWVDDNTTEFQYQNNWVGANVDKDWWRCDAIRTASATGGGSKTFGTLCDRWVSNNMSGSYTGEIGEFPVEYLQNGDDRYGLYVEAWTFDDDRSGGYAEFKLDPYQSSLRCETKVFSKITFFQDIMSWNSYRNNHPDYVAASFYHLGLFGFSVNERPRSKMFDVYGSTEFGAWPKAYQGQFNAAYLNFSKTFMSPYPYGQAEGGSGGAEYGRDGGDHEGYSPNIDNFNDWAGQGDFMTSYFVDPNWNKLNHSQSIKYVIPSYFKDTYHPDDDYVINHKSQLKEFYMFHDVIIDKPLDRDFYVNVAGRVNPLGNVIQSPPEIIEDIFAEEVNFKDHFENIEEANEELGDWVLSFSLLESMSLSDFMSDMFKNVLSTVRFSSDGKANLFSHKRFVNHRYNIDFTMIDHNEVIKYSYKLTDNDEIANQVNVLYDYNSASDTFRSETGYGLTSQSGNTYDTYDLWTQNYYPSNPYSIDYYTLFDNEGKLEFESKYIYDINTARKLQRKLLLWNINQHVIISVSLPLKYLNLEVGDYIQFSDLINNEKAFGYDYSIDTLRNGQLIYNKFIITAINKTSRSIDITCIQAHRLELGFPQNYFAGGDVDENGECWTESNINISSDWLIPEGLVPDDDAIVEEDELEEEDSWLYEDYYEVFWRQDSVNDTSVDKYIQGYQTCKAIQVTNMYPTVFVRIRLREVSHDINILGEEFLAGQEYAFIANDFFRIQIIDHDNDLGHDIQFDPLYEIPIPENEDIACIIRYEIYFSPQTFSQEDQNDEVLEEFEGEIDE